jgi:hypothetical protein
MLDSNWASEASLLVGSQVEAKRARVWGCSSVVRHCLAWGGTLGSITSTEECHGIS